MFIQGVTFFVTDNAYTDNNNNIKCIGLFFGKTNLILHGTLEDLNSFKNQLEDKIKMEEKPTEEMEPLIENTDLKEDELPEDQVVTEIDPDELNEDLTDLSYDDDEEDDDEEDEED